MAAPMRKRALCCLHTISRSLYASRVTICTSHMLQKEKPVKFAEHPPRVFSGIQPTGIPHLGNYVGALRNWVQVQRKYDDVIFSIVDLHSITVPQDPHVLRENILDMTACLLACGIDPNKSILFQQSSEKSEKMKDPNVGLYTYPILQTADIILYKATFVPVGEDQTHHIELARDLAKSFNRNFGVIFPQPQAIIGDVPKIRSLRNPDCKMSKSETSPLSRIELTDSPDEIREKIKKAVTDFTSEVTYNPSQRPGVSNLIDIHSSLTDMSPDEICEESLLLNTGEYKEKVAEVVIERLGPIRDAVLQLKGDKSHLEKVLRNGQERAASIAEVTMKEVKRTVGFS